MNRTELIGIFLSVVVMALMLAFMRFDTGTLATNLQTNARQPAGVITVDESNSNQNQAMADAVTKAAPNAQLQSLIIDDITIGEGPAVKTGDTVAVHYIGRLQNGAEFDNSYSRGAPFTFTVGQGRVIEGWDKGIVGMQVGGQRVLVVPAAMAYGKDGFGPIPGNANLVFSIELLEIQ
jgi:FKBP-type peptidyl-prolyl cis-trans isomerase